MRASLYLFASALTLAAMPVARAGFLWNDGANDRTMYADRKAARTGDIVTIVVSESVAAQSSQSTKSNRDSSVAEAVQSFLYPAPGLHKGALPSIGFGGKATYNGGGDISNNQSLASRAAALVTDVLPNGNLVIEAVRVVT